MDIDSEIRQRILAAAVQLFEQSGRREPPSVEAVRALSKSSMQDASAIMRDWRRQQRISASAGMASLQERIHRASEAQALVEESINVAKAAWDVEQHENERLRLELSSAFETQAAALEAVSSRLAEVERNATGLAAAAEEERVAAERRMLALTEEAQSASGRVQEIEKRAKEYKAAMKAALDSAQDSVQRMTTELAAEREQHGLTRRNLKDLRTEVVALRARVETQSMVQTEQAERLKRLSMDLAQARATVTSAREEAALLRDRGDSVPTQHAELLRFVEARDKQVKAGKK